MLRVLSLCDHSGIMVRPWLDAGADCWTVDLRHPPGEVREGNLTRVGADVTTWEPPGWYDVVFAFPPCTHLASSGARWFKAKGIPAVIQALTVVNACKVICERATLWALENPVGTLSTYWRAPDHRFDPCDYGGYLTPPGDAYRKRTCLWVGGSFVMPEPRPVEPVRVCEQGSWVQKLGGGCGDARSVTPSGFARAVFEANYSKVTYER